MKLKSLIAVFLISSFHVYSQSGSINTEDFRPDPEKEKMFFPYIAVRHGGPDATREWKKSNIVQYYKEVWYYTESFYIKRDHLTEGVTMDEAMIDISRFESERKPDTESIVILGGYKDVLVLLPSNKLKYNPGYK